MSHRENFGCGYYKIFQFGEGGNDLDGFEADGDDLADEAENIFAVVIAVAIVGDATAFVGGERVFGLLFVGEMLAGLGKGVEGIEVCGDSSCLRALPSGNGLRQSGIVFFFCFVTRP